MDAGVGHSFKQLENTPLADRVREAILEAILEKRFDSGRLPSEDELGRMLNVSRTTIRTALQGLERDGIITRRRAIGTRINRHVGPATLALQRLVGFDWLLKEKGHKIKVDVSWSRAVPPAALVEAFALSADEEYLVMEKLYYADGDAAIYVRDIVPWAELKSEPEPQPPASLFEFSKRYLRRPIDHAVVELAPMVKRDGETTRLETEVGEPFMRLYERHYPRSGDPTAFSVIDADDDYIRFEVFRRAQR
ncbi:MAG TPA: GntR family transcriptional regulator [Solirubrobacteraceae bacterium]|nr:GntR family transcriptional regulator [Solirubrobacteraceae bacterium]